jgi:type VI secretion system protein ImpK
MSEKDPGRGLEENDDRTVFRPMPAPRQPPGLAPTPAPGDAQPQPAPPSMAEEGTIFRPNPGGRRPASVLADPARKPPPPAPRQAAVQGLDLSAPNANPIMQAAGPLLLLLGRLRTSLLRAPGPGLTPQIAAAIEKCERDMRAVGVAPEDVDTAKYVLCATADEVLANLPDEDRNPALQSGLMTRFFGENNQGSRFFDELDRVKQDAPARHQLLELFQACLALGFQGGRQTLPGGAATLQDLRHNLSEVLQKSAPAPERQLSPRWEGQPLASHAVSLRVPLWTAAGLAALIVFTNFVGLRLSLGRRAEAAAETLTSLNPQTPVSIARKVAVAPPPAPPPTQAQASQLDHIRKVLEPNIDAGALSVDSSANQIVIHITDRALFQPGRATVLDDVRPLMMFIALALDDEKGAVKVVGHSDNTPISNARFASNFELSLERAKVVGALLKQSLSRPERVEVEGKGADVPIASNDTPEGRNKNRRVEIVVPRSD